jgi:hypothetical protein
MTRDQLRTELLTDPTGQGYAPHVAAGAHQILADLLNAIQPAITIRRTDVMPADAVAAIDLADIPALPSNPNATQLSTERRQLAYLGWLAAMAAPMRLQNDDGTNAPVVVNLLAVFPSGSPTRARLIALATRPGSRAERLAGPGVVVTHQAVADALAGEG